ncbi:MAG: metallophosphoesterase [Clostridia bacterium]|nr:metallophosphoesterase [Clostridia bacterium]
MGKILFALIPLLLGIGFFFWFFLKRLGITLGINTKRRRSKIILLILTVLLTLASAMITNLSVIYLLHVVAIGAMMQLINLLVKRIWRKRYENGCALWKKIYGLGLVPLLLSFVVLISGYFNLHSVVRTDYTVTTEKNIRAEGYRVALIADVHFGVSLNYEELLETCREISAADPDIVILCGDMVDSSTSTEELWEVFRAFGTIQSEFGTFFVYGNHDRTMSKTFTNEFSDGDLETAIRENGITLLQDDTVQLTEDLVLIGREDLSRDRRDGGRLPLRNLLEGTEEKDFLLVLDHQPNDYTENGTLGTDLLLSGHTHGGQFFPLNLLMRIIPFNDGTYGMYDIGAKGKAIVTSGLAGWNFPIKTAAPAEYVIIDIRNP